MTLHEQMADTVRAPASKQCGCGANHDPFAWSRLPFVGVMADEEETIELRNCACGSTLAIEVPR